MATLKSISNPVWGLSVLGYGVIVEGIAAIRQRMDLSIRTTKGTDPLRPEFGSLVNKFIDRPTAIAVPNIKKEILTALSLWVPEIKVISIRHSFPKDSFNPVFEITYRLLDENLVDVLLFDLRQGLTTITDALNEVILQAYFPDNPNGYNYHISLNKNGSYIFPQHNPQGFATIPELFDWVKSNWAYVGKWHLLSDKIVCYMSAKDVTSATLTLSALPLSTFSALFPPLLPGQFYKVTYKVNGADVLPVIPQTFTTPGGVLQFANNNWLNVNWFIEYIQDNDSVFSDQFSDQFDVPANGYKLIGVAKVAGFNAQLQIISV